MPQLFSYLFSYVLFHLRYFNKYYPAPSCFTLRSSLKECPCSWWLIVLNFFQLLLFAEEIVLILSVFIAILLFLEIDLQEFWLNRRDKGSAKT